jgi:hypothetical protein
MNFIAGATSVQQTGIKNSVCFKTLFSGLISSNSHHGENLAGTWRNSKAQDALWQRRHLSVHKVPVAENTTTARHAENTARLTPNPPNARWSSEGHQIVCCHKSRGSTQKQVGFRFWLYNGFNFEDLMFQERTSLPVNIRMFRFFDKCKYWVSLSPILKR